MNRHCIRHCFCEVRENCSWCRRLAKQAGPPWATRRVPSRRSQHGLECSSMLKEQQAQLSMLLWNGGKLNTVLICAASRGLSRQAIQRHLPSLSAPARQSQQ